MISVLINKNNEQVSHKKISYYLFNCIKKKKIKDNFPSVWDKEILKIKLNGSSLSYFLNFCLGYPKFLKCVVLKPEPNCAEY